MKLTLANIKELKRKSDSPLTKRVCNYVIDRWSDYSDKKGIFTDVLHYGCQSGVVGELIYYSDTVRFYKQYRQEINALLYETMNGTQFFIGCYKVVSYSVLIDLCFFGYRLLNGNFAVLNFNQHFSAAFRAMYLYR